MSAEEVRFEEVFKAPRERVFAFLGSHANWARLWGAPMRRTRAGEDPAHPDGVGSVREINSAGLPAFDETILVYEPPLRIEYTVSRGSPVKNHRGVLMLEAVQGGTRLVYTIAFDPKIPLTGGVIARSLKRDWTRGLARVRDEIETG